MSGWIQSAARAQFAAIRTALPECVKAVNVLGATANGIVDTLSGQGSLEPAGGKGIDVGTVRVDASEITRPALGSTITVGGEKAVVLNVRPDPAGALLAVEYQATTEVS